MTLLVVLNLGFAWGVSGAPSVSIAAVTTATVTIQTPTTG